MTSRRSVAVASMPASLATPCAQVACAVRFYHLSETSDFSNFASIVTPDVKWRQRGLLQGKRTLSGAEEVHNALLDLHNEYQDLTFTVNVYAEEEGRVAMFWTAVGTNRASMFGMPPSFKRSTFSGVTLVQLTNQGLISEVIEYRQPTHEEMAAHLRKDLDQPHKGAVERLLLRGHAVPAGTQPEAGGYACQLPASRTVDPMWRIRAVQAATEWVENWTPGPDLEKMVRDDIEEYNIYSWPDFDQDVIGRDALEERRSRNTQDAVVIKETIADSTTNVVVVHWFDFEQPHNSASNPAPIPAASGRALSPKPPKGNAKPKQPGGMPDAAIPREQPTLHPEHGSVEVKDGHLRVHLSAAAVRRSLGSEDETPGGFPVGGRLHKFRGVTLFRLDDECKLAWMVTFRELKATELDTYLLQKQEATAAASGAR
ncbi:hypothetical protein HYH03_011995 [Edaphochlamys debaryana]|uniref:Uncharacterized protein n=1 Tax=Edaphochlamys debaryana TaxID=47281 RepID=A0A835Y1T5_9CHLO|nr:hypothetical protein HYH03_011995 [Edaphochlamys debaryana]|eukprot:KAG2489544.1 hypothetical protein HYH03_011995 [Edaphochlamys debaryana]